MSARIVDYLVVHEEVPAPVGLAYDYLLGGDGLYVAAHNRYLEARVPVARARVRGLPPLGATFTLRTGRLCQGVNTGPKFPKISGLKIPTLDAG